MLTAGIAGAFVMSDDSNAATGTGNGSVTLDDYYVAVEKTTVATVTFSDSVAPMSLDWTAKVTNSSGTTQSNVLSKTSGSLDVAPGTPGTDTIDVTAPKTAGDYVITVTYKEKIDSSTTYEYTAKATLHVCNPIVLSIKVSNSGHLDFNDNVYFYVDGVRCDDSEQRLIVAAGETKTVEYKYFNHNLSSGKHTYYVTSGEVAPVTGLDAKQTFYYNQDSQDYMLWIVGAVLVLLILFAVWVFRKPVKNYGKPKARR